MPRREGAHEDLVLACALACWAATYDALVFWPFLSVTDDDEFLLVESQRASEPSSQSSESAISYYERQDLFGGWAKLIDVV
jgi:hypothetical protein